MKLLKNKTIIGIIAIVLGILICFIFTPLYNQSLEAKTKVVRVDKKIEKGQLITNDLLKVVEVGSYNLPEDIILKEDQAVGKYAITEMYPEEYIVSDKLSVNPLSQDEYLVGLDGSNGAISITLQSFAAGLSGKLLSGDIVSIITTDTGEATTNIPPELKYVKVLACTTVEGKDVDENTRSDNDTEKNTLATTVTLLVNDRQAVTLANLESMKKLHVELVYRGLETESNQFLKQQNLILEQITEKERVQEEKIQEEVDSLINTTEQSKGDENE